MSSDGGSQASTIPKTKQERIRDNQRRSRARRQEYLTDLERRLSDCNVTYREVELQRTALADLQSENARLRALLAVIGVNPEIIENYGRQNVIQPSLEAAAASHRQIKPKYQSVDAAGPAGLQPRYSGHGQDVVSTYTSTSSSVTPHGTSTDHQDVFQVYGSQYHPGPGPGPGPVAASAPLLGSQFSTPPPPASYDWMFGAENDGVTTSSESQFCCEAFHVPLSNPFLPDDGNTVMCTVARAMIDQYGPTELELAEIKSRLSTAFSRSSVPGQSCRVNNQVLFQVLNEMNAKQMNG